MSGENVDRSPRAGNRKKRRNLLIRERLPPERGFAVGAGVFDKVEGVGRNAAPVLFEPIDKPMNGRLDCSWLK